MTKHRLRPRNFHGDLNSNSRGFFYRLFLNQRFLAILGLFVLVLIVFPLAQTYSQRRLVSQEIQGVKDKINHYELQNKQLGELMTYLNSKQYLETQARLNFNMKKPGEEVVVVEDKKIKVINSNFPVATQNINNFQKWWQYFFK